MSQQVITLPSSRAATASDPLSLARDLCETIGCRCNPAYVLQIPALQQYFEESMLYQAAESAAMAVRPSWVYFRAILRRCAAEGCYTSAAYTERIEAFREFSRKSGYSYDQVREIAKY